MSKRTWAILLAGGSGERFSATSSKLLANLNNKPVLAYSWQVLQQVKGLHGMVIVSHPNWQETYQDVLSNYPTTLPVKWVYGGATRRDSVYQGLQALDHACDVVLIHDAARPLVDKKHIQAVLDAVLTDNTIGAVLGVACQNTLKQVTKQGLITHTVPRQGLWQVHTPQVFDFSTLYQAHQRVPHEIEITDDAQLVELAYPDLPLQMVQDSPRNLKITTSQDLSLAQALLLIETT